jgi:hypothetical protein
MKELSRCIILENQCFLKSIYFIKREQNERECLTAEIEQIITNRLTKGLKDLKDLMDFSPKATQKKSMLRVEIEQN